MAADDSRTRILDAAEALFAQLGFDATPTTRIADAAGVPKGLVFYYFPRKIDLLLVLLEERLPAQPPGALQGVVRRGDPRRSLLALHRRLGLDTHDSLVLRTIIFRESGTHPEVRAHLRRQAAETFVSVMFDYANSRRAGGAPPDIKGAAAVVARAVGAPA
jgi:AcrR family transcriptional regulator